MKNTTKTLKLLPLIFSALFCPPPEFLEKLRDFKNMREGYGPIKVYNDRRSLAEPKDVDEYFLNADRLHFSLNVQTEIDIDLTLPEKALMCQLDCVQQCIDIQNMNAFIEPDEDDVQFLAQKRIEMNRYILEWVADHALGEPKIDGDMLSIKIGERFKILIYLTTPFGGVFFMTQQGHRICRFQKIPLEMVIPAIDCAYNLSQMLQAPE